MNFPQRTLLLLLPFILATSAVAAEKRWSDEAEVSVVSSNGNSKVTTLAARNLLRFPFSERFSGSWKLQGLYGENDGIKNAESYAMELRGDYAQSERLFYFASASWLQDEFAGIDVRDTYGLGIGYKFLDGPTNFLVGEAGLIYTTEENTDGTDSDYPGGRLFARYDYKFNDANKFTQSVEFLPDFDEEKNWLLNSETALVAALNSTFSMKTSYLVKYDHQPLPGLTRSDTLFGVALVANF